MSKAKEPRKQRYEGKKNLMNWFMKRLKDKQHAA